MTIYDTDKLSIPLVEMRVRALGEHFGQAIALHANEIVERVRNQVEAVVKNFDFESYVRSECEEALRDYMTKGAGGEAVREMAAKLGDKILTDLLPKGGS